MEKGKVLQPMPPSLGGALKDFNQELAELGYPEEEIFRVIVFGVAAYLEKGATTLEDQMRLLNANDRETLVEMDRAIDALRQAIHDTAY